MPEPVESGVSGRLPIDDASANVLALVLIGGPTQRNSVLLRQALEHDPALALWVVVRASASGHDDLRSVESLAAWIVSDCRLVLFWPDGGEQPPTDEAWLGRYRRLMALSVMVARRASELAAAHRTPTDEAFLIGLLHAADAWWTLDAAFHQGCQGACPVAGPSWLADALARLRETATVQGSDAVAFVARARQTIDEAAVSTTSYRIADGESLAAAASAALSQCLPELAKESSLWRASQADFDGRLEAAKLAAMAELAAGAGHEINNPIAVIAGRAQLLLDGEKNPQRRRELAVINTQAMRVFEMISDMMLFARPPTPVFGPCDVAGIAQQVAADFALPALEKQVEITLGKVDGPIVLEADATQLAVALRAICDNALTASARGGRIAICVAGPSADSDSGQSWVSINVSDNGLGISPQMREHVFDPFYSGCQAGRGLGMGLAKAWRILTNHGGRIEIGGTDQGTKFVLTLPTAR